MENQRNSVLNWAYYGYQGKAMEELRHCLLYTTMELEQVRLAAQEELRNRDEQLIHLKDLLSKTMKERDEAQEQCQILFLEKLLLQQQHHQKAPLSGISEVEDEPRKGVDSNSGFSSSDCEESIVSSPGIDPIPRRQQFPTSTLSPTLPRETVDIAPEKPLPEKGKLLQAVIKAGPLLQTLLLAGQLPQWRHPPPPLESFDIPPVTISSPQKSHTQPPPLLRHDSFNNTIRGCNRKRVL